MPSKTEIIEFLSREFPQTPCTVEEVGDSAATVKRRVGIDELRPGGTVSGPVLMEVADVALYIAIVGVSKLMKVGGKLVVGEVSLYSEGMPSPVAHAVGTYSIPPRPGG